MKIYVIQLGDNSDHSIAMATTDKEHATETARRLESGGYSVLVYELEDGKETNHMLLWTVCDWPWWRANIAYDFEEALGDYDHTFRVRASSPKEAIEIAKKRQARNKAKSLE